MERRFFPQRASRVCDTVAGFAGLFRGRVGVQKQRLPGESSVRLCETGGIRCGGRKPCVVASVHQCRKCTSVGHSNATSKAGRCSGRERADWRLLCTSILNFRSLLFVLLFCAVSRISRLASLPAIPPGELVLNAASSALQPSPRCISLVVLDRLTQHPSAKVP